MNTTQEPKGDFLCPQEVFERFGEDMSLRQLRLSAALYSLPRHKEPPERGLFWSLLAAAQGVIGEEELGRAAKEKLHGTGEDVPLGSAEQYRLLAWHSAGYSPTNRSLFCDEKTVKELNPRLIPYAEGAFEKKWAFAAFAAVNAATAESINSGGEDEDSRDKVFWEASARQVRHLRWVTGFDVAPAVKKEASQLGRTVPAIRDWAGVLRSVLIPYPFIREWFFAPEFNFLDFTHRLQQRASALHISEELATYFNSQFEVPFRMRFFHVLEDGPLPDLWLLDLLLGTDDPEPC